MKKVYRVKVKLEDVVKDYVIPRHPEIKLIKAINKNIWQAKDLVNGDIFVVERIIKGSFVFFELN